MNFRRAPLSAKNRYFLNEKYDYLSGTMQHPAESGRYVKLYNAMLYLHCELNCLLICS